MSDRFIRAEFGLVENLSVDSTTDFISWASISVLEEHIVELVEFSDDVAAGFASIGLSAFYSWWVARESSRAGALESALVVGAHARWSTVVSSCLAFININAAGSVSCSVAFVADWARALIAAIDVVAASSWSTWVVEAFVDVIRAERSLPV